MSEKSGTGEGRGGFLREGFEGGREGGGKWERGFPVAFSSYRWGGYALLPRGFFSSFS